MTIDTSKWDKVSFGDVARCLTIATKDPLSEGFERDVGLEHIEPGNIHIKSWGEVAKGTTFTRVFRKGQVLFGKRRAYQKKAALAEFDGICSGDILVCEANEGKLIPELLPFVVQSDRFFDFAIKTSAGSLSPRTKFKDLAKFSLKLPSKPDDQKRIADLLWSIDEVVERWNSVINSLDILFRSLMKQNLNPYKTDEIKIKELLRKSSDFNVGKIQQAEYGKVGKFPIIDQSKIEVAGYSDIAELLYSGDLPVLIFGDHTTEIKYVDYPFILGADGTKVILPKDSINPKYLFFAILNLNLKPVGYRRHFPILKDCKIKVPEISKQNEIVKKLDSVLVEKLPMTKNIAYLKGIQRGIINQIFG